MLPGTETEKEYSDKPSPGDIQEIEVFLVECLAWGLLRAYGVDRPPVPVREMIEHALPAFGRLTLLEMNLGLYKVAYRSCLDGSRVIVVDPIAPSDVQREGMARELYVAFCRSPRGALWSSPTNR